MNLVAMASTLEATASALVAMASTLEATASALVAMASTLLEKGNDYRVYWKKENKMAQVEVLRAWLVQ